MQRLSAISLALLLVLSSVPVGTTPSAYAQTDDDAEASFASAEFGIGLQATGSACCISLRQWTAEGRGLELTFMADRLLMLGLRGMSKFADTDVLDPYTGAGVNLVFGPRLSRGIPLTSLQFLLGLEAGLPFMPPQLTINVEAALEFELDREFYTYVGGGLHFYF